jgi:hypothetical protein
MAVSSSSFSKNNCRFHTPQEKIALPSKVSTDQKDHSNLNKCIEPLFTQGSTAYRRVIDKLITYNLNIDYEFDGARNEMLRDTKGVCRSLI